MTMRYVKVTQSESPQLDQFDEIRVIFSMAVARMHKSVRVAIEHFLLVPPN
jgi:hypothetical protein